MTITTVTRGVLPGLRCEHLRCQDCEGAAWCCCCDHFHDVKAGIQALLDAEVRALEEGE